jgi:hypothetical protein
MVKCIELQEISFKTATFSLCLMAKCAWLGLDWVRGDI